ncbi:hypothetical protein Cgig2_008645 [Carnegiea gigantea]|uniref:RNase H type-1 domain-containing protein n=1 Tax=Carnegiea gigantea TaxID=171969 RepID=A0A9Q1JLH8_9CARY|nr:hypothetical protein Cgig2_008645 [Carnegiea gigantea]
MVKRGDSGLVVYVFSPYRHGRGLAWRGDTMVVYWAECHDKLLGDPVHHASQWSPLAMGYVKVNFDGAKLGEWGHRWDVGARDGRGNVLFASVVQGDGFLGAELEGVRAVRFALSEARKRNMRSIVLERDCLTLITKLQMKARGDANIGVIIFDIVRLASCFDFCAFSFVKRGGNRVAHYLARIQPHGPDMRI